jgi:fucose 4-O-acetylase-like acetyltransferase
MVAKFPRLKWIDVIKGIAICLVVSTHALSNELNPYFNYIHIAGFVFASGLVHKHKSFKQIFSSILLPYLVFSGMLFVATAIFDPSILSPQVMGRIVKGIVYGRYYLSESSETLLIIFNSPLWYLPMLFVLKLIAGQILKLKSKKYQWVVTLGLSVLGWMITWLMTGYLINWGIELALILLPLYVAGNYSRKLKVRAATLIIGVVVSALVFIITTNLNGPINISLNRFGQNVLLFYLASFAGVFLLRQLAIFIDKYLPPASIVLSIIGKYSIYILAFHMFFIALLARLI